MSSLWLDRALPDFPAPEDGREFETLVVGAGLTGLTTALLLARAGSSVAVVEARHLGAGTTGHSTAKVSLLQGTRLSAIRRRHCDDVLRRYVQANAEGLAWLTRYCADHDVPVQLRAAYTYAVTDAGVSAARRELAAAQAAGLQVRWVSDTELPFPVRGAVELADQAQVDPLDVLTQMSRDLLDRGGVIYQGARVRSIKPGRPATVRTDRATLRAQRVVLATGIPLMDRGGFWARLQPLRSYALAFRLPGPAPQGMYLSADPPTRSVRSVPRDGAELLLTGGNGHVVGRDDPAGRARDLLDWTVQHFPGAELTHSWSAQDYHADHELPFVGPLTPRDDRVLLATGFDKWGLTMAVASGVALSSRILGGHTEWATALETWTAREFAGAPAAAKANLQVGVELVGGWVKSMLAAADTEAPAEGRGRVERHGLGPVGVCTVAGRTMQRSAVCTHLGGIVAWNDAEMSWDCPLHGSRFAVDGRVLEGPATKDLPAR